MVVSVRGGLAEGNTSAVSTNNGLVKGPVCNLLMQLFTLGILKIEVFKT